MFPAGKGKIERLTLNSLNWWSQTNWKMPFPSQLKVLVSTPFGPRVVCKGTSSTQSICTSRGKLISEQLIYISPQKVKRKHLRTHTYTWCTCVKNTHDLITYLGPFGDGINIIFNWIWHFVLPPKKTWVNMLYGCHWYKKHILFVSGLMGIFLGHFT